MSFGPSHWWEGGSCYEDRKFATKPRVLVAKILYMGSLQEA